MNPSCEDIREMLVDYADGALSEPEARVVAGHLADCSTCRTTVEALTRSLDLTQAIWDDNLQGSYSAPAGVRHRSVAPWARRLALAAGILIAVGGALLMCLPSGPPERALAYAEVERQVTRTATAARLLAATQLLAQCEGTDSFVQEQCRYLLADYADTPAAVAIRNSNYFRRVSP